VLKYLPFLLVCALLGHAEEGVVTLAAVGDVMLGRGVPARIAAHGPAWPWAALAPELARADLRFCNLECAVTAGGLRIPKPYSFRADPAMAAEVLRAGGFDVAALANNHTYDYGRPGLADTITAMAQLGIAAPGAGRGRAGAVAPQRVTRNGLTLAFVAYTVWPPEGYLPSEEGASVAMYDEATFAEELRAAHREADLLIVSLHWGKEYSPGFTPAQQRLAHRAIDAGADLILGHHPHVTQPVEVYQGRPILYSLGNCLFDRTDARYSTGALALVRLTRDAVAVERLIPFVLDDARPALRKTGGGR